MKVIEGMVIRINFIIHGEVKDYVKIHEREFVVFLVHMLII